MAKLKMVSNNMSWRGNRLVTAYKQPISLLYISQTDRNA